jgi:AraC family transcriptional regulator
MTPIRLAAGSYYGTTEQRLDVAGVTFTETIYGPGTRLPHHTHESAYLCLVVEGEFDESLGARHRACAAGHLLVRPAGETHAQSFGASGGRCFNIHLGAPWESRIAALASAQRPIPGAHGGAAAGWARRLYGRLSSRAPVSALSVEGLVCLMLAELAPPAAGREGARRASRAVGMATDFIRAHFRSPISLTAVAAAAQAHPTSLARAFRSHHGVTVGAYIRSRRVEWAQRQLRNDAEPLASLALSAGFHDQAHFTRTFRSAVGCPPGAYRRLSLPRASEPSAESCIGQGSPGSLPRRGPRRARLRSGRDSARRRHGGTLPRDS